MRAVLELGHEGILVVYKLDRLGRNALDVQETLAVLLDAKVRVVSLADGLDSASGMGSALLKLLTGVLSTFAELERETITTRLLDGRRRADREGRKYAVEARYGRRLAEDGSNRLEEAPEEQMAISLIKKLREVDGMSYRAICERLHREGLRPRRAERWAPAVVGRIITGTRASAPRVISKRVQRARAEWMAVAPPVQDTQNKQPAPTPPAV